MDTAQTHRYKTRTAQKMQSAMQCSIFFEKPGEEFWRVIKDVENSEIFTKLHEASPNGKVISISPIKKYIPLPGKPESTYDYNISSLLVNRDEILSRIKRLGRDWFTCYFLERQGTDAELAEILQIDKDEIKSFKLEVIDRVQITDAIAEPYASLVLSNRIEVTAEIIIKKDGIELIFARSERRYAIDDKKLKYIEEKGLIPNTEIIASKKLVRNLELINLRFGLLTKIVEAAVKGQSEFLISGDEAKLKVFEAKSLAEELKIDPSWISRLIRDKYLKISNRFFKLRDLFVPARELLKIKGKILLKKILARQNTRLRERTISRPYSDEEIRIQLMGEYDCRISRRTINNWRRGLEGERKSEG